MVLTNNAENVSTNLSMETKSVGVSSLSDSSEVQKNTISQCSFERDKDKKTEKTVVSTSTGTSPPPQNMSTQVFIRV